MNSHADESFVGGESSISNEQYQYARNLADFFKGQEELEKAKKEMRGTCRNDDQPSEKEENGANGAIGGRVSSGYRVVRLECEREFSAERFSHAVNCGNGAALAFLENNSTKRVYCLKDKFECTKCKAAFIYCTMPLNSIYYWQRHQR